MRQLLYTSTEAECLSFSDIHQLLLEARRWNAKNGITGLLLHAPNGRFIQLIEGDADMIEAVFARICSDQRHSDVNILLDEDVDDRLFPGWEMGFSDFLFGDKNSVEDHMSVLFKDFESVTRQRLASIFAMAAVYDTNADTSLTSILSNRLSSASAPSAKPK